MIAKETSGDFIHSPLRYNGHQAYALGSLMSFVPRHTDFIEPFCGGSGLFFAKEKVQNNRLNDVNCELVAVYKTMRDNPHALFKFFSEIQSEEKYNYIRGEINLPDDASIAARWFYLDRTSRFNLMGKRWEMDKNIVVNLNALEKLVLTCSKKLKNVIITCGDFEETINSAPDSSFVFMSPPYSFGNSPEKTMSYTFPFFENDHLRLLETLKKNSKRIKFLLTYPDNEIIRKMYSWSVEISTLHSDHNFIGDKTKTAEEEIKENEGRKELIIKNF